MAALDIVVQVAHSELRVFGVGTLYPAAARSNN